MSPATVVFTAVNWNMPQTVAASGVNDDLDDGDVAYTIVTAAATSTDVNYNGRNPADVPISNMDNDTAGITVNPTSGLTTTEAGGTATFTVVLNTQPTADVTIGLSSSDTSEGTVSPASVTFTAANWSTSQAVTVRGQNDDVYDGNVGYTIVLAAAVSADSNYLGLDPADVSVRNTDNDAAGITVSPSGGLKTTEAGGAATFTIYLGSQPTAEVTIGLASSDLSEGTVSPAAVTFTAANWSLPQTVTITGVDDDLDDGNVPYTIFTAAAVSADNVYNGLNAADASVTNTDNDTAGIIVSPTNGLTATEAGGTATFTIVLKTQPTADVTIGLSSDDLTEGTISLAGVTFTPTNWKTAQTVTVTGVDDAVDDGDVAFSIVTLAAASSDANYSGLNAADVTVTNLDDDTAGITISAISGDTTEAGGTATFTVVLNTQPTAGVTIGLSSGDLTEGTVSPAGAAFTPANWNVAQIVTVTGVDDWADDGNIAFTVVTAAAVSSDANYQGMNAVDVALTNLDDDTAGIAVSPTGGLTVTEAGGTASFTAVLTAQPGTNVVLTVTSGDTGEAAVSPTVLTFTPANWDSLQTVTVTGVDDLDRDGDQVTSLTVAVDVAQSDDRFAAVAAQTVSVTTIDDDAGLAQHAQPVRCGCQRQDRRRRCADDHQLHQRPCQRPVATASARGAAALLRRGRRRPVPA